MGLFDDWGSDIDSGMPSIGGGDSYGYDGSGTGLWNSGVGQGAIGSYGNLEPETFSGSLDSSKYAPLSSMFNHSGDGSYGAPSAGTTETKGPLSSSLRPQTSYAQPEKSAIPSSTSDNRGPWQKALNMKADSAGDTDYTDPKSILSIMKLVGAGAPLISALMNKGKQANAQSAAQLQAQLPANKYSAWSPTQQQWANDYFNQKYAPPQDRSRQYASEMRSPVVAGHGYAGGGAVGDRGIGAPGDDRYGGGAAQVPFQSAVGRDDSIFDAMRRRNEQAAGLEAPPEVLQRGNPGTRRDATLSLREILQLLPNLARRAFAEGGDVPMDDDGGGEMGPGPDMGPPEDDGGPQGPLGYVQGPGGGQADDIKANLSGGEYVFDADTVAALGDGNNEAGAQKLDELREAIRKRNRSAPPDQIPPPAEDPAQQLGLG